MSVTTRTKDVRDNLELALAVMDPESLKKETPQPSNVTSAVLTYMLFSSTMLITNKAAVMFFPLPSLILWLQLASSALLVKGLGSQGVFEGKRFRTKTNS